MLNSVRNVFQKWGTYKGKSAENKMSSTRRPQGLTPHVGPGGLAVDLGISAHPGGGFGYKCSSVPELSVPWSCGLTLNPSLLVLLHVSSARLTPADPYPLELCLAHVCPTGRSFEHWGWSWCMSPV